MGVPWWVLALGTVATLVGVGYAVFKAYSTHEWRTCQCVDCRQRRYRAHKAQGHHAVAVDADGDIIWGEAPKVEHATGRWVSTAQLEERMVVRLHNVTYRVTQINTDVKGYLVGLQPMGGTDRRKPMIAAIPWSNGNRRMWEVK
jgi:hypothetical protein